LKVVKLRVLSSQILNSDKILSSKTISHNCAKKKTVAVILMKLRIKKKL